DYRGDAVLDPPRLLRPIPYVPETIAHLPPYSLEALRAVRREACAPLYHCRCSICERAMAVAQVAQGGNPATASAAPTTTTGASAPEHTHAHCDGPIVRGVARRGGRRRVLPAQGWRTRGRRSARVLAADGRAGGPGRRGGRL
ncbi:hypothetical protein FB451DRAFT_1290439, partial [Mycena latifolia]